MPQVLIVDDELPIRSFLSLALTNEGYRVRTAANAFEAMAALATDAYDVMLSDVQMPDVNGHELVRWVARHYPSTRSILMTGLDIDCQECPYAGRCAYLPKPFSAAEARSVIEQALSRPPC